MNKFEQYCQSLGVLPGASSEEVKRSFRSLIKRYHPDSAGKEGDAAHAKLLIEAYLAFKGGVPPREHFTEENPLGSPARGAPSDGKRSAAYWRKDKANRQPGLSYSLRGRASGQRMSAALFGEEDPFSPSRSRMLARLLAAFYGQEEQFEITLEALINDSGPAGPAAPAAPAAVSPAAISPDALIPNRHYFDRAEAILEEIVHQFEGQGNRFQPSWARDFIRQLVEVQVLYRDVCRLAPRLELQARQRVQQVNELIKEIRRAFR